MVTQPSKYGRQLWFSDNSGMMRIICAAHIYKSAPTPPLTLGAVMNRKKKMNKLLNTKIKKTNAKLQTKNKPRYIAKADRVVNSEAE